jgi:peptide deformylase
MAVLKIYTYPELVLAQKAKPIERISKEHQKLAENMLETMYEAPGIGLAANQVGVLEKALVIDVEYDTEEIEGESIIVRKKPIIIFNPEIIYREGEICLSEACLSVPDYSAEVKRSEKIKIQYRDIDGKTRTLDAEGLQAVALQHEMDHLDGKLCIDRISAIKSDVVKKKLIKAKQKKK